MFGSVYKIIKPFRQSAFTASVFTGQYSNPVYCDDRSLYCMIIMK